MGLVKSNVTLYTSTMDGKDVLDEYYRVFKVKVHTIEAHDGDLGYHLVFYRDHLMCMLRKKVTRLMKS